MRPAALVSAVALIMPASAFSQDDGTTTSFKTGTQLYQACTAASDSEKLSFCIGYVMGVSDSLQSLHLTCSPLRKLRVSRSPTWSLVISAIIPMPGNLSPRKK